MQDSRTGEMFGLDMSEFYKDATKKGNFEDRIRELTTDPRFLQRKGEEAGIPLQHQGPVFQIDEEVELKGGRFKVRGFEGGLLHLQGLPNNQRGV